MSYFTSVALCAAACGLTCVMIPEQSSSTGKALRALASLVMLLVVLSPLVYVRSAAAEIADDLRDFFSSAASSSDSAPLYIACGAGDVAERIERSVCAEFSVPESDVSAVVTFDTSSPTEPRIASTVIRINTSHIHLSEQISDYVCTVTGAPCAVTDERSVK